MIYVDTFKLLVGRSVNEMDMFLQCNSLFFSGIFKLGVIGW